MTKFFNISTDATLGGVSPSDDIVSSQKAIKTLINTKQDTLVSGTNIKTINNESLLGSGNITIGGGTPGQQGTFNLFDFKWADHELGDMAWLRADTFSWQPGATYSNAYNHLVDDATVYEWDVDLFTNKRYPQVGDKVFINNSGSATHYYVVTAYNESTGVLTIFTDCNRIEPDRKSLCIVVFPLTKKNLPLKKSA